MISVEEARHLMMAQVRRMRIEQLPLASAPGRYSAEVIAAPCDHPLFDCSAVDGYALAGLEDPGHRIVGNIAAGEVHHGALRRGECVRIFTGAEVPQGAETVVMQEDVSHEGDLVHAASKVIAGANIRRRAEQLRAGDRVMEAGWRLTPPALGLLASVGVGKVAVPELPRVEVFITGGEFISGAAPEPGRIFNSNDVMLSSALQVEGYRPVLHRLKDDRRALKETLRSAMELCDVLITTGGASVGDHDLIAPVLLELGASIHFHNVAQKPGKPMLFATIPRASSAVGNAFIFGLPGNPRAVMVLFWEYVLPFLRAMQGARDPWMKCERLPLSHPAAAKGQRTEFRAATVADGSVALLADEGSHMLRSLMAADALACIPAGPRTLAPGDAVEVHWIPR